MRGSGSEAKRAQVRRRQQTWCGTQVRRLQPRRGETMRASDSRCGAGPSAADGPEACGLNAPAAAEAVRGSSGRAAAEVKPAKVDERQLSSGSGLVAGRIRAGRQPCPQCSAPGRRRLAGQEAPAPPRRDQKLSLLMREGPPVQSATNPDPRTEEPRQGKGNKARSSPPSAASIEKAKRSRLASGPRSPRYAAPPTRTAPTTEPVDNTKPCGQPAQGPPDFNATDTHRQRRETRLTDPHAVRRVSPFFWCRTPGGGEPSPASPPSSAPLHLDKSRRPAPRYGVGRKIPRTNLRNRVSAGRPSGTADGTAELIRYS